MSRFLYDSISAFSERFLGPFYRRIGKRLYVAGTSIQGENASEDRLVPSLRKLTHSGYQPQIQGANFIAPNATIIGNVKLGYNSSVWYGATIMGTNPIQIGEDTVIQDRVHISRSVKIGNNVFIGPNTVIQGSQIEDGAFVSMGATVRHAKVQSGSLVAAGAVINDNIEIKEGQVWAGNPGKFLRHLTAVERQILREHLQQMRDLAIVHDEETQKSARQVISGKLQPYEANNFQSYLQNADQKFQYDDIDEEFAERRTAMKQKFYIPRKQEDYEGFEYNTSHLGQKFNLGVHSEEFKKIATKIKEKENFSNDRNPWNQPF